jgi:hypothetical protein
MIGETIETGTGLWSKRAGRDLGGAYWRVTAEDAMVAYLCMVFLSVTER